MSLTMFNHRGWKNEKGGKGKGGGGKCGEGGWWGGTEVVRRDCAVLKIPFESPGPEASLILTQIVGK